MKIAAGALAVLVCSAALATEPVQRSLSFDDRVEAQKSIDRVYYAHQIGTTKPFDEAVPRAVLEAKVRRYLEQSAALSLYWKTAVTDQALGRELERMTNASRMPERLNELFAALGDDPFLIKECLARPLLVDRLARNFQAMDPVMHVKEKNRAERLRDQVVTGALDPSVEHTNRTVSETGTGDAEASGPSIQKRSHQALTHDQLVMQRAALPANVGQVSEIAETHDDFKFSVILSETADALRVANYSVSKISWDDWWNSVRDGFDGATMTPIATGQAVSALSRVRRVKALGTACGEQGWHNGALDDAPYYGVPDGRWGNTAVWTGSEMLIFGGVPTSFQSEDHGKRYDPATDTWTVMTVKNAPTPRTSHTAVWTGSSMIVWGGTTQGSVGIRQTGGRYDPMTDTWTRTSTRNAPLARYSHTAVWTGTEMVIWGGIGGTYFDTALVNTGGRYDPDTDTWRPTSTTGAPSPRAGHTAIWTGTRMVIWSGGTGGRYDPVADTWLPVSNSGLEVRSGHTAVWTGHYMVIWGGTHIVIDQNNGDPRFFSVPTNAGARYNPTTDRWSATSMEGAPPPRGGHIAIWTGTEMLIWGGTLLATGGRYNVTTDTWTPMSITGAVVWGEGQTAVWTGSLMIAWGGLRAAGPPSQVLLSNTGGRYDPESDSWTPTSVGSGVSGETTVWTGSQMIAWGGFGGRGQRFDPATDTWSAMTTTGEPTARIDHTAVWVGSSMMVWGGWNGIDYYDLGGRYDPAADAWSPVSTSGAPSGRVGHRALWTGSEMLVWGGQDASNPLGTNTGGTYDPESDHWTEISTVGAPSPRSTSSAVWTGTKMVIWGGLGLIGPVQTGGRYDPETDSWSPTSLSNAPSARLDHTAVWVGDYMVVWGGRGPSQPFASGGRYDPVLDLWTPTSLAGDPPGHARHSAVSTGRAMIVWGGLISTSPAYTAFNTGLLYDPITDHWTKLSKTGEPEIIYNHTAIWTGSAMIVWSGTHGGQFVLTAPIDGDCDGDGVSVSAGDCDDSDATIYPSAPELCDGKSNNCSDQYWPDVHWTAPGNERDADEDGFTVCQGDCDDYQASVYPGAPQVCDGVNNDCTAPDWPAAPDETDSDHDGVRICEGDCDDTQFYVRPGRPDYCDGIDGDCDGTVDNHPESLCGGSDVCNVFTCQGIDGCVQSFTSNPCDDFNPCTTDDTCNAGYCRGTPQIGAACDDQNPCTIDDACDSNASCRGTPALGMACDDRNQCTFNDVCNSSSSCRGTLALGTLCDDGNDCTFDDVCTNYYGCVGSRADDGTPCYRGNPCSPADYCHDGQCYDGPFRDCDDRDRCDGIDYCDFDSGECVPYPVPLCDDHNECTGDTCDPIAGCVFTPIDAPCDDGDACTVGDRCVNRACLWGPVDDCDDANPCTDDSCDVAIGCLHVPHAGACDDGNACTALDTCQAGVCVGTNPVVCGTPALCQAAGVCEPTTGVCHFGNAPDGTTCSDGELCTTGETCQAGVCTPAANGPTEPNPRTNGYYKRLCHGPHSGDQLTSADGICVAGITRTFAGISTVADLCAMLEPSHPNYDPCDRSEDDLIVLALNICRARVCTAQSIDSQCGGNGTVGQSLAESDAILNDASRSAATCAHAKCLDEEINTGRALELNSLTLRREGSGVRLSWNPPYLDDGSGHPSKYNVWRRQQGSLAAFTKIATTTEVTLLDALSAGGAFQYEVTAVMGN